MQPAAHRKIEKLKKRIEKMGSAVIAFSGGVDSTFLVRLAHDVLEDKAIAVTATSSTYPKTDFEEAKRLSKIIGIRHIIIESEETEIGGFKENPADRCYYCKKELFSKLKEIAGKENIHYVLDGTNYDDLSDYRPGMQAAKELNVVSPIKDAKLTKDEIRALSKELGLDTWDKPASPCLASRFPYGTRITRRRLGMVGSAESAIRDIGIKQVRVRYHGKIARIEVDKKNMGLLLKHSEDITKKLKGLGFTYITLDLEGYRAGSLNEVLKNGENAKRI